MRRPVVLERGVTPDGKRQAFRFVCDACELQGSWHPNLNDAETAGARHNAVKHDDREVARA